MAENFDDLIDSVVGPFDPGSVLDIKEPAEAEKPSKDQSDVIEPPGIKSKTVLSDVAEAKPYRLTMWEADDLLSTIEVMFNPTEFEAGIDTDWNRFVSPGGSYAHLHFVGTRNFVVEMEIYWNANTVQEQVLSEDARMRLMSWCYPERTDDHWSLGPPRLWAMWPGTFQIQCYLVELKFKHLKFGLDGRTTKWSATIKLEEASDEFIGSSAVRAAQTIRGLEERPVRMVPMKASKTNPRISSAAAVQSVLRPQLRQKGKR